MEDQTDDLSRLLSGLRRRHRLAAEASRTSLSLDLLRRLGEVLHVDWQVTAVVSLQQATAQEVEIERLIDVLPGHVPDDEPLWGLAIDVGTTTVTVWLVDLVSGQVKAQVSEYNAQIARRDVISRIVYASKERRAGAA
jgi:uncharacterized 2Fe-2S/4Fe-4S cluster protein (DUF4445 family)